MAETKPDFPVTKEKSIHMEGDEQECTLSIPKQGMRMLFATCLASLLTADDVRSMGEWGEKDQAAYDVLFSTAQAVLAANGDEADSIWERLIKAKHFRQNETFLNLLKRVKESRAGIIA